MRERNTFIDYVTGSQRLKALREEKGLSHQTLSDLTGINKQSLINYERAGKEDGSEYGTRVDAFGGMSINTAVALAKTFGVSTDYLLGLSSVKSPDADIQAICKYTGMSEKAVQASHKLKDGGIKNSEYYMLGVSKLFESGLEGLSVLDAIAEYLKISPANTYQLVTQSPDGLEIKEKYDASYLLLKSIEENLRKIREKEGDK